MGHIDLSNYIYSSSNTRNINILFTLIMKHYIIICDKEVEINIKDLWDYFDYNKAWLYDNNLNKIGILYY